MKFHIITLFPEMFDSYLKESILARAIKNKKVKISILNPRKFTKDKHSRVDSKACGGGPGMVMQAMPILKAYKKVISNINRRKAKFKVKVIVFSPSGKEFTNVYADKLLRNYTDIVLISGRYEGIDARVKKILKAENVSIGNYTLTGGELPAMVCVDVITRRIKGVLGNDESVEERRVSSSEFYTRPEIVEFNDKKYKVPKVLLSGNHKKIDEWKKSRK